MARSNSSRVVSKTRRVEGALPQNTSARRFWRACIVSEPRAVRMVLGGEDVRNGAR